MVVVICCWGAGVSGWEEIWSCGGRRGEIKEGEKEKENGNCTIM